MFQVYHSNQLDLLKDLLVALMQQNPLPDPFENETVLVQSPGMAQWLNLEIAQATGISANIDFPLPASFIWQQFKHVLEDVPENSPFNKMSMTWQIMTLLPQCLADDDFAMLKSYLEKDEHGRKLFQLSGKIADIFDQYLVYRPEWIDAWEHSSDVQISTWDAENTQAMPSWINDHRWQAKLWKKLSEKIENKFKAQGQVYHRAGLYKDFLATLDKKITLPHLPKRIFVFGVSALPESYLHALLGLAKHCDIHFLLSNPCQYYWADIVDPKLLAKRFAQARPKLAVENKIVVDQPDSSWQKDESHLAWSQSGDEESEVGNPLLASMGKMGRDFLYQLYSLEQNEVDAFVSIERDSLLHHIQADILELQDSSDALALDAKNRIVIDENDKSLSLHLAHSMMREVEILHDNLLAMFADDNTLTPKDIIVMMPNIDLYAPYVQAVFASVERNVANSRYIPFAISDVSAQQENPILVSFLQLLKLNQSRYTRENVLALLEVPAILDRFKLQESDFILLKKWIDESGVRWGLNDQSGEQWDLPNQSQNSWLFGLRRMLLGYAMGDAMFEGISAYDEVQGLQGEVLGKFIDFIDALLSLESTLNKDHNAPQWKAFIHKLIENFYLENDENTPIFLLIRKQIDSLLEHSQQAQFESDISLFVLIEFLDEHLSGQGSNQRFLAGQVNFCTLMPMRSIPFKVVCLLGMNDGQYPRNIIPMGFDLMAGHSKRGDRSRRDEDRYLFLEAMLSARDVLYMSYIGRNISDNSEKMPSVLVTELVNYCLQSFVLAENVDDPIKAVEKGISGFINHHYPMQAFSESYYKGDAFTYNPMWYNAIEKKQAGELTQTKTTIPLAEAVSDIQISQLKSFLKHPCKHFFNQRLGVSFDVDNDEIDHDEPFSLDNLQKYFLKEQQFEYALHGKDQSSLYAEIKASGKLPLGEFAPLVFEKDLMAMEDLASLVQAYFVGEIETVSVDLFFEKETPEQKRLLGELTDHCENGLVRIKTGKIRGKDILGLWVDHLCYCVAHHSELNSSLFGQDNGIYFEELSADYAYQKLRELLDIYELGLQKPLPFFEQTSFAWAALVNNADPDCFLLEDLDFEARSEGQDAAMSSFHNDRGFADSDDIYIKRIYENLDEIWPEFEQLAFAIYKPILANISTIEYGDWEDEVV